MKLLAVFGLAALTSFAADLSGVKSVYLLPMSGGLDQYLAVRLTSTGAFQVLTDPAQADAIFTDRIGTNFEKTVKDLYDKKSTSSGAQKVSPIEKVSTDGKGDPEAKKDDEDNLFNKPTMQPLSRGKGSLFLVDRKTHVVLWSMFAKPKSSQAEDMNQLATQIAAKIGKDRKTK